MNLAEMIVERSEATPEQAALIECRNKRKRVLSYAGLEAAASRTAGFLHNLGLRQGDTVLVILPMSIELYVVILALFRLGLIAAFPPPSGGLDSLNRCCAGIEPKAFLGNFAAHGLRFVSPELRRIPLKISTSMFCPGAKPLSRAERLPVFPLIAECLAEHPALLTFTSGSTGEPKAAVRSHGFLLAQYRALCAAIALQSGEVDLATLPVFVLANLAAGVTSLIPHVDLRHPGRVDGCAVLSQIETYQADRCTASPAFYRRLADACLRTGRQLTGLKKIYTGGAPVFPDLLEQLRQIAPKADVACLYGSTEAEPIAHLAWGALSSEDRAAIFAGGGLPLGTPVPQIRVRILPDRWGKAIGPFSARRFSETCLPVNTVGEIVVTGEHVLPGYMHGRGDPETKFSVASQRWHRTGDAGYLDDRGLLWLVGRCIGGIHDGWGDLYPLAVEAACRQFSGIANAAVVAYRGKRLLLVEPAAETEPDLAQIRENLAWARIGMVRIISKIPLDSRHNAKIDYPALHKFMMQLAVDDS